MELNESKISKVLRSDLGILVAIVVATVGVLMFFGRPILDQSARLTKLEAEMDSNQKVLDAVNNLRDNHIHGLETKVDDQAREVHDLQQQVTEIKTILEERLPKK